jgi:ATP-GRASP peptide maturase of grasp-with-spasm system
MILICSEVIEPTTDVVCGWLTYFNKKYIRISSNDLIEINSIYINDDVIDIDFSINNVDYKMSQITSYWYRRSWLGFKKSNKVVFKYEDDDISDEVNHFLKEEHEKQIEFFEFMLDEKAKLNKFKDNKINKLKTLALAKSLGVNIPKTIISDRFNKTFFLEKWITKPISDLIIRKNGFSYSTTTKRVTSEDFSNISVTKIQEEINKKFEIRTFYFNDTFYSSVIFSQENPKTELDFRNYDTENPNRVVPYKLPKKLEKKLKKLCNKVGLKSGSFDIAYTNEEKYVLFEINPVGQFEQVSFPCNYKIHKEIAKFL